MTKQNFIYSFFAVLVSLICFSFIKESNFLEGNTQIVTPIDKAQLLELTQKEDDSLYVINFWATWCAPCVRELPHFNAANKKYTDKISMKLISMDFDNQLEERVIPFFSRKKFSDYTMDKYLITSIDYDSWMSKIDKDWSGSIPATLFYNKTKNIYHFHEGDYKEEELYHTIDSLLAL
ncbi:Thioredoxin [Bernardetia litoralis DSM 6794]|uniref:Thioredoxin n=1 Tax=Bernardetia litoralis (strain ATCC 23117 / DSM 6794 / NBRC 15988 / NCIMB 1366 / Fx l1 / Sio-4) TaxID=880071 RepID=I4AMI1_BERLS|nr:TlpA family protein disulfide reductase [Bernardetia litoralis]AFM05166.1 Thioredoxin [Bernardetia litoralis DSM 6794]